MLLSFGNRAPALFGSKIFQNCIFLDFASVFPLLSNLVSQCFFPFNLDIYLLEEETPSWLDFVAFFTTVIEFSR
jgi:hypothetical protein